MYIEILFLFNFYLDFMILMLTSILLKRKAKINNLLIGGFIGSLSIIILFLKINTIQKFILKVYLSIIMNLFTFYYKNLKFTIYNIITFYFISITFGGFIYLLKLNFNYSLIALFLITPVILFFYLKEMKLLKLKQNNYYDVTIFLNNKQIFLTGYLDSGNTLKHKGCPVVLTNLKELFQENILYIPYKTASNNALMPLIKVQKILINKAVFDKVYLGYCDNMIDEAQVLLNREMEG